MGGENHRSLRKNRSSVSVHGTSGARNFFPPEPTDQRGEKKRVVSLPLIVSFRPHVPPNPTASWIRSPSRVSLRLRGRGPPARSTLHSRSWARASKPSFIVACNGAAEADMSGKKRSEEATCQNGGLTKALHPT